MKRSLFMSLLLVIPLGAIVSCKPLAGSVSQVSVPPPTSTNTMYPAAPTEQIILTGAAAAATQQSLRYKDIAYTIEGQTVVLKNGVSTSETIPGSSTQIATRYFGNEAFGDLNGDGIEDVAFILTQETGGSGVFFYVVAALSTEDGWQGLNGVLLGDRISPQSTVIENGVVMVNYDDRKPGDPFTSLPSVGVIKYLKVIDNKLVEVNR